MKERGEQDSYQVAYFDVDGTLTASNIVEPLIHLTKRLTAPLPFKLWQASLLFRFVYWNMLDMTDRQRSTRAIYGQYKGMSVDQVMDLRDECYKKRYKDKLFAEGVRQVQELKDQGTEVVLVSGSLDFLLEPLAVELGADLIATSLQENDGVFTGMLEGDPVVGYVKVERITEHAKQFDYDLGRCVSYGNSIDDFPMMRSVGAAIAVNPSKGLKTKAVENSWEQLVWR